MYNGMSAHTLQVPRGVPTRTSCIGGCTHRRAPCCEITCVPTKLALATPARQNILRCTPAPHNEVMYRTLKRVARSLTDKRLPNFFFSSFTLLFGHRLPGDRQGNSSRTNTGWLGRVEARGT